MSSNSNIVDKFKRIIRQLDYSQIRVEPLNINKIISWSKTNLESEVKQLKSLGWDMFNATTWMELVFSNCNLNWYGNLISFYVTSSYLDFNLANKIIGSTIFSKFRSDLNLYNQVSLLVDPLIMIEYEDLDTINEKLNLETGYSQINLSHYTEHETINSKAKADWGWLDFDSVEDKEWTPEQLSKVVRN